MTTGELIIKFFDKYKFRKEIPTDVREKILFSKKRIHNEIMNKRCGTYAAVKKDTGMKKNVMLIASAAALAIITTASLLLIMGGGLLKEGVNNELVTAKAVFVTGDVTVKHGETAVPLKPGDTVQKGDVIVTGEKSFASLQVKELGVIKINGNTRCTLAGISSVGATEVYLEEGSVYSSLKKLSKDQTYKVKTRTYTASVRGTEFLTSSGKTGSSVKVLDGVVNVASSVSSSDVAKENGVNIAEDGAISEYKLSEIEILELKRDSLIKYLDNLKEMDRAAIDSALKEISAAMAEIDAEIAKISEKEGNTAKPLSPLDRLRKMNKPLTMIYLRDGSQIAGSVSGQRDGKLKLDTGEGVISIPVNDIIRRMPIK